MRLFVAGASPSAETIPHRIADFRCDCNKQPADVQNMTELENSLGLGLGGWCLIANASHAHGRACNEIIVSRSSTTISQCDLTRPCKPMYLFRQSSPVK